MFYIIICLPLYLLSFSPLAFSYERFQLSDNLTLKPEIKFCDAIQLNEPSFKLGHGVNQGFDNLPTSTMALSLKYYSFLAAVKHSSLGSFQFRTDYLKNIPFQLSLFQKSEDINVLLLRDFYYRSGLLNQELNIWVGVRTFEFPALTLLALPNPFDQIALQGVGIEYENLQFSASVHKGRVKTISSILNYNASSQITTEILNVDVNNNPIYLELNEYIVTLFLSGKLLLAEGRLFEPIFSFRYYTGGKYKQNAATTLNIYRAKASSALIVGGIFSRPITNGVTGTTTVWFSSLPGDEPVTNNTLPINNKYAGAGRENQNTPRNTIGIVDASQFYFSNELALLTAFYLTNNTYAAYLPILKVSEDRLSLIPDGSRMANSNNKLSLDFQPIVFVSRHLILGLDFNFGYTSNKIFYDDSNGIIISPLAKWVFNGKFNSQHFLFTSLSYGLYDWKIKRYDNYNQTNSLLTLQAGAKIEM